MDLTPIIQAIANLTTRLNQIVENARTIAELPWQSILRPASKLQVYNPENVSEFITVQQVVDATLSFRQNQLLSIGTITVVGNNVTIPAGATWVINNIDYSNASDIVINVPYAEEGNTRTDIIVADQSNNMYRINGPETAGVSPAPNVPLNTVLVTTVNVTDSTIGTTPPIIGTNYELIANKQNSLAFDGSGIKYSTIDAVNSGLSLKTENSAGAIQGFALTNNSDGTVNIAEGTAFLRATNDQYAPLLKYTIPAVTNLTLTDNANNFVLVDYNAGTPALTVTTNTATINTETNSLAIAISRVGNNLDYISLVGQNNDANAKLRVRFLNQEGIRRANGAVIGFSSRNLTLTSGVLFSGLIRINSPAFNTASPDSFTYVYNNGSAWTRVTGQTQVNNTQYNNAGTLTTMPNNEFRVDYVYLLPNNPSKLYVVYGNTTYNSITLARNAPKPASLPSELQVLGLLVGRQIIQKSASVISEVTSAFDDVFTGIGVPEHNSLAGLQGGTANDYQHLTTAQLNGLIQKNTIAQIRALSGTLTNTIFYTTDIGQEGNWYYDATDTTSADNTGTILVTSDGKRIKRVVQGAVNVLWFGAKGDITTDNTTAFQKACDFITSKNGGSLFIPYGRYKITSTIQVNSQILFFGEGSNSYEWLPSYGVNNNGSAIEINSNTVNAFQTNVSGVSFENLAITNLAATPTTSIGIKMISAGSFNLNNISIKGFFDSLDIKDGTRWNIDGCNLFFPSNYGIHIHSNDDAIRSDSGDMSIVGTNIIIDRSGVTGIKFESPGGLKIVNTKINPANAFRVKIAVDVEAKGNSSILLISNSSFEGFAERAIKIISDGTHTFDKILLNGNQMESYSSAVTYIEIQGSSEKIRSINIVDNIIMREPEDGDINPAILINGIVEANLSGNLFKNFVNHSDITNTPYIFDADGYGGTIKGQSGIGNNTAGRGYRGFSNLGLTLGEDLSGFVIKTDLDVSENANVLLNITGNADLPVSAMFQLVNLGNGSILTPVFLNKGAGITNAKAFYLSGKLCFWIKPDTNYSNFNFEIQTSSQQTQILDRYVSIMPTGGTVAGTVDFVKRQTAIYSATGTLTGANATLSTEFVTKSQLDASTTPYKKWVGAFVNNGTSAPTVTVLENSLGGTVVWTRSTTGTYIGTLSGAFNVATAKTLIDFSGGAGTTANGFFSSLGATSANTVQFSTYISGSLADSVLNGYTWIEIRVYP